MITCPKCSKDNQDHYKFCLGCGAELPRDVAPKPFSPQTPPQGMKAAAVRAPARLRRRPAAPACPAPVADGRHRAAPPRRVHRRRRPRRAAPAPARVAARRPRAGGTVICPQCGHVERPEQRLLRLVRLPPRRRCRRVPQRAAPAPVAAGRRAGTVVLTALRADGSEAGTYSLPGGTQPSAARPAASSPATATSRPRHATFSSPAPAASR